MIYVRLSCFDRVGDEVVKIDIPEMGRGLDVVGSEVLLVGDEVLKVFTFLTEGKFAAVWNGFYVDNVRHPIPRRCFIPVLPIADRSDSGVVCYFFENNRLRAQIFDGEDCDRFVLDDADVVHRYYRLNPSAFGIARVR